jgi:hypothetical protein
LIWDPLNHWVSITNLKCILIILLKSPRHLNVKVHHQHWSESWSPVYLIRIELFWNVVRRRSSSINNWKDSR